jgi:LemA protein
MNHRPFIRLLVIMLLLSLLTGCGINNIPTYDEAAKAARSQILN